MLSPKDHTSLPIESQYNKPGIGSNIGTGVGGNTIGPGVGMGHHHIGGGIGSGVGGVDMGKYDYGVQSGVGVGGGLGNNVGVQIFLRPVASPSAMGLAGFFTSTWLLSTFLCSWYGSDATTPGAHFSLIMIFGGLGQFIAGLYGYAARDNLATVMHVTWGSFFLAYGLEIILSLAGAVPFSGRFAYNEELGMWLVCLAAITWCCFLASFSRDIATIGVLFLLASGSTVAFAGYFAGSSGCIKAAGYLLMLSSLCALYRMLHFLMLEGFEILPKWFPVWKTPWESLRPAITNPLNEPGVKKGQ